MKLQKLLDEYKYNKKDQDKIKKEIIRLVQNYISIELSKSDSEIKTCNTTSAFVGSFW